MPTLDLISALTAALSTSKAIHILYDLLRRKLNEASPEKDFILRFDKRDFDDDGINRTLQRILEEEEKYLPPEMATSITLSVVDATYYNLNGIRQERLRQAKSTFNAALVLTVMGVLIIFCGVGLIFADKLSAGIITTAGGSVTQIISALLFKFNKESNDRLDAIGRDLHILDKARLAMHYIEQISDGSKKDKAIADLVKDLQVSKQLKK